MKKHTFSAHSFSLFLTLAATLGAGNICHVARAAEAVKTTEATKDVSIQDEGGSRRIKSSTYEALVGADGALPSLKIGGQEFLVSTPNVPRGAYLYQGGLLKLEQIAEPEKGVVTAQSEKASLRYQFTLDEVSITATNTSDKSMLFYMVFDPAISAFFNNQGDAVRPFATLTGQKTTSWFGGKARLKIEGGDSVFGPWSGKYQVWQASVAPQQSRTFTLSAGTATAEELAQIALLPQPVAK